DTTSLITTGSVGELLLAYTIPSFSVSSQEVLTLDNSIAFTVNSSPASGLPSSPSYSGSLSVADTTLYTFTFPSNEEITSIEYGLGAGGNHPLMIISVSNEFNHDLELAITIPSLELSGINWSDTVTVSPNSIGQTTLDMSNYIMDLTQGSLGFNELVIQFGITINGTGQSINPTDKIGIDFQMTDISAFDVVYGDFKNQQISLGEDSISFSIFQVSESAIDFVLTNPSIEFNVENSFGFTSQMAMTEFYSQDSSGTLFNVTYDSAATNLQAAPFYFPSISKPSSQGAITTTDIFMNSNNSNFVDVIGTTPKQLNYAPSIEINPNAGPNSNYITSTSQMTVNSEITLPLEGYAGGWRMGDTIPFDFEVDNLFSGETTIEEATIKFVTTNGWPVDVDFTLLLLDSNKNTLSTIANDELILQSGVLDASGKVIEPTIKVTELYCDSTCVDELNVTKFVVLSVDANTANYSGQQPVKIYEDYKLGVAMSLLISGRMF
ncbi:MAG: hypothetical protein P8L23_02390, partial [Flavobacteriales bacterium]|nr:hypothetical protein [Flavobacteriales bacterium]